MEATEIMFESEGWDVNVLDMTDWNNPKIIATVDENGVVVSGSLSVEQLQQAQDHIARLQSL
jgi:hypothetical protein